MTETNPWYHINIAHYSESTGTLSVLEYGPGIPFLAKRVFWVSRVPSSDVIRGGHAHECLKQVIFCSTGSCKIELEAQDGRQNSITLKAGGEALFVDGPVWRSMHNFTPDCTMVVICDREYTHDKVIRSYEDFKAL